MTIQTCQHRACDDCAYYVATGEVPGSWVLSFDHGGGDDADLDKRIASVDGTVDAILADAPVGAYFLETVEGRGEEASGVMRCGFCGEDTMDDARLTLAWTMRPSATFLASARTTTVADVADAIGTSADSIDADPERRAILYANTVYALLADDGTYIIPHGNDERVVSTRCDADAEAFDVYRWLTGNDA